MRRFRSSLPGLMCIALACGSDGSGPNVSVGDVQLEWQFVVGGLSDPIFVTAPSQDSRLFIAQQNGIIRVVDNGALVATAFLDLSALVGFGGERGLLGMAFHPDYGATGFVFVYYTDTQGTSQLDRYTVSADPNIGLPNSRQPILSVSQPFANHNGGMISFGPDGHLYLALGDGGDANDPLDSGQDTSTLLGSILRLDVDGCSAGQCAGGTFYRAPPNNPFVGTAGRDEIWAYGLRNPWRFSFDQVGGILYIGDVGQNAFEEIDARPLAETGVNYGWRTMEGMQCRGGGSCDMSGLTLPVVAYPIPGEGCAVVGGYVYRGSAIPALTGHYFYSDFCAGWLRSFRLDGGAAVEETEWDIGGVGSISSFGQDSERELYVTAGSAVYRLVQNN